MRFLTLVLLASFSATAVDYEKDIKPIFEENCAKCHGEKKQKSDFRLDDRESILKGGDWGEPGAVPGHPEKSSIIEFISLDPDDDDIMPPKGDPLKKEQIALISEWIKEGAKMPAKKKVAAEKLWSLEKVKKPAIPLGEKNVVDAFLKEKLSEQGLDFSQQADPVVLLRRLQVVLTGILPTPAEKDAFLEAWVMDADKAYSAKVEELLASDQYGERWAQHWLDAIRWAETSGSESNLYRKNSWHFRDYVIRAFNQDKPYTDFIIDQLAGDQTGYPRATGYLVSGPHVPPATVGQQQSAIAEARYDRLDQVMQTVGASIMGMTLGCARCHTHKFDPIKINDYYSILANFQGVEFGIRKPELAEHAHHVVKGKKIMGKIQALRQKERSTWKEQWHSRHEARVNQLKTRGIRLVALSNSVALDEVDIYNTAGKNIISQAKISTNIAGEKVDVELLRDGMIGQFYGFKAKVKKGDKKLHYIQFDFAADIEFSGIALSKDRKAPVNTDYLLSEEWLTKLDNYKIEYRDEQGKWKVLVKNLTQLKTLPAIQDLITEYNEKAVQEEFIGRFIKPVKSHVLKRGSASSLGAEVVPGPLTIITASLNMTSETSDKERRMTFAKWLASDTNPLTARVMVNRLWYHTFGDGIVSTLSDFGNAGAKPSHPELLDYLASEFVEQGWSTKNFLRLLVNSKAFKQDNKPKVAALKLDAGSRLLWRYAPRRAEAEVIRDSVLKFSDSLDLTTGGPSYRIHGTKKRYGMWKVTDNYSEPTWRRMIYQERMRGVDDRMFTAFDFPDCGQVLSKRPASTTPLQALNLMNSKFMENQCDIIAKKVESSDPETSIRQLFLLIYNRQPSEIELVMSKKILKSEKVSILCRAMLNSNEFIFIQ
ncbi:PSD1 and planctomycete cytochrome C domain-containing protein [Lentisphaera profundi]|uniref:PSD1 and planctomycete cytochrome C domain-containing protein n=1 Tax=Lentisphaera profundi TaxID=1658616 RepID=A0ABY7VRQ4_9BACT|nr:PSD1 and planctomycete cytochrome C domain-containing protein [Lentisphaera profundi]WDE96885.1 PSD1 and planctomycete cytochrome C domain-containing protein [Lentisphaera profundi]